MRYTYGTIAAVSCSILVLATFWPQQRGPAMPSLLAQSETESPAGFGVELLDDANETVVPAVPFQGSKERIAAKLAEPLSTVEYVQMTFRDVIFDLSQMTGLTITIDPSLLNGELDPDALVDLEFPENAVSTRTLLEFAFKSIQCDDFVGYTIRDNIVLITSREDTTEVVIYNCRDLIYPEPPQAAQAGGRESGGVGAKVNHQLGGGYGGLGGGEAMYGGVPGMGIMPPNPEQQLIEVITGTIDRESWSESGGPGSIQSINGLIVINHTREVHDQVKNLLQLLRNAMQE